MTDEDDLQEGQPTGGDPEPQAPTEWESAALVAGLLRAAGDSADIEAAASAILDELGVVLGLSGAALSVLAARSGSPRLETISATGTHSGFAREMPSLALDGSAEAVAVLSERRSAFVGDIHGLGRETRVSSGGVGRWRQGVVTNAYAQLPLAVRDDPLGVLTLEWGEPRSFSGDDEIVLGQVADLVALVLYSFHPGAGAAPTGPASTRSCEQGASISLSVTRDGVVVPAAEHDQWGVAERMRLSVKMTEPRSRETASVFWEASGVGRHEVMLAVGTAVSPAGGADALAEASRQIVRARISQGGTPAEALETLAESLGNAASHGAWVSARVVVVDMARSTFSESHCGSTASLLLQSGGRFELALPDNPPVGPSGASIGGDRFGFVFPRDGVALCTGRVADLARASTAARDALRDLPDTGGAIAAGRLLAMISGESCAEAVIVAEMVEPPPVEE